MFLPSVRRMVEDSIDVKRQLLEDAGALAAIARVAEVAVGCLRAGGKVMLAGNGGSAADAQHIAAELVARFEFDRPGLAAIALTTDSSILTAVGNDYGYEQLFARQVMALGRPGDLFIGISTSGNSRNILRAVEQCRAQGLTTVALCGETGQLRERCDHALAVPSRHTPRIQECHILIGHILCALVEETLWAAYKPPAG